MLSELNCINALMPANSPKEFAHLNLEFWNRPFPQPWPSMRGNTEVFFLHFSEINFSVFMKW